MRLGKYRNICLQYYPVAELIFNKNFAAVVYSVFGFLMLFDIE